MRILLFAVSVCVFSGWLASCGLNPKGELPSANQEGDFIDGEDPSEPEPFGETNAVATTPDDDVAETDVFPEPEGIVVPGASEGFTEDEATGVDAPFEPEPPSGAGGAAAEPSPAGGSGGSAPNGGAAGTDPLPTGPDGGAGAPDGGGISNGGDGGVPIDGGLTPPLLDGGVPTVP